MSDNNETWFVEPRPINAYELAERVRNSMDYNPHDVAIVARNHKFEHEHFLRMIAEMPTLPMKHGEWVRIEKGTDDIDQYWICSKCGDYTYFETNYCPNCGCKMDGGKENDQG